MSSRTPSSPSGCAGSRNSCESSSFAGESAATPCDSATLRPDTLPSSAGSGPIFALLGLGFVGEAITSNCTVSKGSVRAADVLSNNPGRSADSPTGDILSNSRRQRWVAGLRSIHLDHVSAQAGRRAHNSAVECHLHTVEVVGSNPAVPTPSPKQSRIRCLHAASKDLKQVLRCLGVAFLRCVFMPLCALEPAF